MVFHLVANEKTTGVHVPYGQIAVRIVHHFQTSTGEVRNLYLHDSQTDKPPVLRDGGTKKKLLDKSQRLVFSSKRHTADAFTITPLEPTSSTLLNRAIACLPVAKQCVPLKP